MGLFSNEVQKIIMVEDNFFLIQEHDQGAYSCEAINIRGSVFAVPDSILVVRPTGKVCSPGFFNREASNPHECIKCFCFGVTADCDSADLFTYQVINK